MKTASRATWRSVVMVLALISAVWPAVGAAQVSELSGPEVELRRRVMARFDVVPLAQGVALSGASVERRVEIDNGVVMAGGVPLTGEELRRRLGADAALVLRLSYVDNAALRRMFASPPAAPVAPPAPPAPAAVVKPPVPPTPAPPPVFDRPSPAEVERVYRRTGARLTLGKSITVAEDEDITEAVVALGGSVRIEGRVRDGVVVVGGDLELAPTAEVRGDISVIGGSVTMAAGSRHTGQLHHGMASGFPGWSWPPVNWSWIGLGGAARWLSLAGTLTRVTLLALAVALVTFVAGGRVTRIGAAATATPWRAGLIGLGTQVLFIPVLIAVAVAMAITIVGLPFVAVVIPLAVVALALTMLLGFTSLAQQVGQAIGRRAGWAVDGAVWTAVLGLGVIVMATVLSRLVGMAPESARVPTLVLLGLGTAVEYVTWTVGLGAAVMTGAGKWAVVPPPLPSQTIDVPSAL